MTFQSKPVLTFGNTEIFVVNTFLQVGRRLSTDVHSSFSEPVKISNAEQEEPGQVPVCQIDDEDVAVPVVPWRTYDSYEEARDDEDFLEPLEPMVNKVSTLEYFERVQAFERAERGQVEKVATFDWYEDAPLTPCPVAPHDPPVDKVSTFDWLEDSPLPQKLVNSMEPVCPPVGGLCDTTIPQESEAISTAGTAAETVPLVATSKGGKELIRWRVDGRKLETQEKQILSPEFELKLPGLGTSAAFRLMILAKETRGKGGRGFLKAKGAGRLFIKCADSSLPEGVAPMAFRVMVGPGRERDLPLHQFSQHSCCPLQENKASWDLLSMLDATSKRLEVSVQVHRSEAVKEAAKEASVFRIQHAMDIAKSLSVSWSRFQGAEMEVLRPSQVQQELHQHVARLKEPALLTKILQQLRSDLPLVLAVLEELQALTVQPNQFHYGVAVSACAKLGKWQQAEHVLEVMESTAVPPNTVHLNGCLDACSKADAWEEALALFGSLQVDPDLTSWNSCIAACDWKIGTQLLADMQEQQVQANVITYNSLMRASAKAAQWQVALACLSAVVSQDLQPDIISFNTCINACEKSDVWETALHLFAHQQQPSFSLSATTATFNSCIAACGKGEQWQLALSLLDSMTDSSIRKTILSYMAAMSCCEGAQWPLALHLFWTMDEGGISPDVAAFNACMSATGQWTVAQQLLKSMDLRKLRRTAVTYVALINCCRKGGEWQRALEVWHQMEEEYGPDLLATSACVSACGKQGAWQSALDVFWRSSRAGIQHNQISFNSIISTLAAFASSPALALQLLSEMWRRQVTPNSVTYSSCAASCSWEQALELWEDAAEHQLEKDAMGYSSCIRALSQGLQGSSCVQLLDEMQQKDLHVSHATFKTAVAAFPSSQDWEVASYLLSQLGSASGIFSAAVAVCAANWEKAVDLLTGEGREQVDSFACSAILSACERARAWASALQLLHDMSHWHLPVPDLCRTSVMSAAVKSHHWELALCLFEPMRSNVVAQCLLLDCCAVARLWADALSIFEHLEDSKADASCLGAVLKACEGAGRWQEVLHLWPLLQELQWQEHHSAFHHFQVSSNGPSEVTGHLVRALELQWLLGYPLLPPGEEQLTHGLYKYLAGMQAMTARELLRLAPDAEMVLDPFCGSGTVLIDAQVAGKSAIGCDISPLAAFVAAQHADVEDTLFEIDLTALRNAAKILVDFDGSGTNWSLQQFKTHLRSLPDKALRRALRFAWLVATQWDERPRLEHLTAACHLFAARLGHLRDLRGESGDVKAWVRQGDNRELVLKPVDAIITSPPYPGVYNYMAAVEEAAKDLGLRPQNTAAALEIGRREGWHRTSAEEFAAQWQLEQEEWLQAAFRNLAPGGTATLMIGDGDEDEAGDGAFDCLSSTVSAASKAGFQLVATATIASTRENPSERLRGMRRTEHMAPPGVANGMQLCQEVETELRELSQECRKKYPLIKELLLDLLSAEYTDRAILKIRHHKEDSNGGAPSHFPLEEILRAILMACETFHNKIVLISLSCLQRLILREVVKNESVAIVVNLMKEQAANGDENVQLKVLQIVMATPTLGGTPASRDDHCRSSHIKLMNETVVEQLMQLLYSLHNSSNANVHHTACAGLRQLAEHLADQAAHAVTEMAPASTAELENIRGATSAGKSEAPVLPSLRRLCPQCCRWVWRANFVRGKDAAMASWADFLKKVEDPSPGEAVVAATISWFTDQLQVESPALAEGYTEQLIEDKLPKELPVQACIRRVLRAVETVAQARRVQQHASGATSNAQTLAKMLAPSKVADVASLLSKAEMKNLGFGLQAEQALWNNMQQHADECKLAGRTPFLFVDLTSKETLPMWLTPDLIGGKFQMHDDGEWPLHAHVPISSLQDLGKALKSATASPRFFRTVSQWTGSFMRYAVVAVATGHLSWPVVLAHVDNVLQLVEQERMKGNRPFLAFLYEELLRKNWARRAEKNDPSLDIAAEAQKIDKDLLDIARHRLAEVMKEAGLSEQHGRQSASSSQESARTDELVARQLAAAEAAQRQTERVTKQLVEAQQKAFKHSQSGNPGDAKRPADQPMTNRQWKTHKWHLKQVERKEANQQRKNQRNAEQR
eukprot:s429_g11.t5